MTITAVNRSHYLLVRGVKSRMTLVLFFGENLEGYLLLPDGKCREISQSKRSRWPFWGCATEIYSTPFMQSEHEMYVCLCVCVCFLFDRTTAIEIDYRSGSGTGTVFASHSFQPESSMAMLYSRKLWLALDRHAIHTVPLNLTCD